METAIQYGVDSLNQVIKEFLLKDIEIIRICRTAVLLNESGVSLHDSLFHELAEKCLTLQRNDGGWTDVEETIWCTAFLKNSKEFSGSVGKANQWLSSQEHKDGGWGKSLRDIARIPVTALLFYFLPDLSTQSNLNWLEQKWVKDLNAKNCLTYKAALTLMAFRKNNYCPQDNGLILKTMHWLVNQQNIDGGWGPWKDHPVGSDPWCTGICVVSLLQYPDELPENVMYSSLKWIREKQLPDGLWPYHYIEDGSAWALYALINGDKSLSMKNND